MPVAYEGEKPYIFISYAHKDAEVVMPVLDYMQDKGFLLWFDAGIEAGSEWPEYIATHIIKSACMITFMSEAYVKSNNCRRELNFAQDKNIPILNVYIEDVKLTDGMSMQLSLSQALFMNKYNTNQKFLDAICDARLLVDCKVKEEVKTVQPDSQPEESKPIALKFKPDAKRVQREPIIRSKKTKTLTAMTSFAELSYSAIGPWLLWIFSGMKLNIWVFILLMIIPHTVIALFNRMLFNTVGKGLNKRTKNDMSLAPTVCCCLSSIIAIIAGAFVCQSTDMWILNFFIAIGLNVIPTIIALLINLFLDSGKEE